MPKIKVPKIKPVENYSNMPEPELINRAPAVYAGLNVNAHFTNLPVSLTDFKAGIDSVTAYGRGSGWQQEGCRGEEQTGARADKDDAGTGRYVELNCSDDMAIFKSSGFEPLSAAKAPQASLSEKIRSIARRSVSEQIASFPG